MIIENLASREQASDPIEFLRRESHIPANKKTWSHSNGSGEETKGPEWNLIDSANEEEKKVEMRTNSSNIKVKDHGMAFGDNDEGNIEVVSDGEEEEEQDIEDIFHDAIGEI